MAAAIVSATVLGTALPAFVAHADSSTLHVNGGSWTNCSDSGSGTEAQPFCTVQAAADAAQPGQTVLLEGTTFPEQVTVTHSGTSGHPITFKGVNGPKVGAVWSADQAKLPHAFVLSGVHDIDITGMGFQTPQEAVLVSDSDRITVDGNTSWNSGSVTTVGGTQVYPTQTPTIRVGGKSTAITVSRNHIYGSGTSGVAVDAGVSGAVVTTNEIVMVGSEGVVVTDAPGTVVTSNSIGVNCHNAVTLAGNSANSTVENNVTADGKSSCPSQPDFAVSASSVTGTKLDYNIVPVAATGSVNYAWGNGTYAGPADLAKATGQGAHDIADTENPELLATGAAIDSADANAPGELDTDSRGNPRVDDPVVPNTGTGPGYYDRGAHELQDLMSTQVTAYPSPLAGDPMRAQIYGLVNVGWAPVTETLDFGDGSPKLSESSTKTLFHSYPGPGTYQVTQTVTDGTLTQTNTADVTIAPAGALAPSFTWSQPDPGNPRTVAFATAAGSPWPVVSDVLDFGDGSPKADLGTSQSGHVTHTFPDLGPYTVTQTVTDNQGRSAVSSRTVQPGSSVLPLVRTIESVQNGVLTETYTHAYDPTWYSAPIGDTPIQASALAFRPGPNGARVIEAVENGALHEVYSAADGWHDGAITGVGANTTALDFSYSPSGQRVIEAIEGGVLHEIYSDTDGWHDNPIDGVAPDVSALSFSYNSAGQRVIEAIEGGVLHEVYSDTDGWHDNPIDGVAPNVSALSFVYNSAGQRVIEAVEGGVLHEVYSDTDGWHDAAVPGAGSNISGLSVKVLGGSDRVIEAIENNQLHEIYTNTGAWHESIDPIAGSNVTAVSLDAHYPIMA